MTALHTLDPVKAVEADDKSRAIALAAGHLLALDAAAALTDMPTALGMIDLYRGKVQQYLRWVTESDLSAETALGMLGPNGHGPGIEAACRSARFHGFDWQERVDGLRTQGEGM